MKAKFEIVFNGESSDYYEILGKFENVSLLNYSRILRIFETYYDDDEYSPFEDFISEIDLRIFPAHQEIEYTSDNSIVMLLAYGDEYEEGIVKRIKNYFYEQFNKYKDGE
jgi:hypothetical protein